MSAAKPSRSRIGQWLDACADLCASVGESARAGKDKLIQIAAIVGAAFGATWRRAYWRRPVRAAFIREILSAGVEASGIIVFLALALGVLLILQYQLWLGSIVQSLLSPLLIAIVVRELAPLLVNLVLIARSGGTMATQLALIHVAGEDRVAEGQGLDPLEYFVIPRVLALTVSSLCLTLLFTAVSILTVYVFGQWIGARTGTMADFIRATLDALTTADVLNLLAKSTLPAALTASICCAEGLGAEDTAADAPRAARIAAQRSVIALFAVSALTSVTTYS